MTKKRHNYYGIVTSLCLKYFPIHLIRFLERFPETVLERFANKSSAPWPGKVPGNGCRKDSWKGSLKVHQVSGKDHKR